MICSWLNLSRDCRCVFSHQAMLLPQNPSQVHAAAVNGDKNTLQKLITGMMPIHESKTITSHPFSDLEFNFLGKLKLWLIYVWLSPAEPRLWDSEDQFGRTPLMYCVLADRLDCAEVLLKAGGAVNKTDHSQRTALHLAAQKVTHTHASDLVLLAFTAL